MRMAVALLTVLVVLIGVGLLNTFLEEHSPLKTWMPRELAQIGKYLHTLIDPQSQVQPASVGASDSGDAWARFDHHHGEAGGANTSLSGYVPYGCAIAKTIPGDTGPDVAIYSWVEDDGVASFSDEPPGRRSSGLQRYRAGHSEFKADITTDGVHISDAVKGQIVAGAKRIYEQWGEWLGYDVLRRSHLNVKIIGDWNRFRRLYGSSDAPAGFYRASTNEAVVFYDPKSVSTSRLVAVAFHEVSHLVLAWQVGDAPPWFNEGLAEYFETMSVRAQAASFSLDPRIIDHMAARGRVSIPSMLRMSRADWYGTDRSRNYASAGLLVAFLQSSDSGRVLLAELAQHLYDSRCDRRSDPHILSLQSYPGGATGLARAWDLWIRDLKRQGVSRQRSLGSA